MQCQALYARLSDRERHRPTVGRSKDSNSVTSLAAASRPLVVVARRHRRYAQLNNEDRQPDDEHERVSHRRRERQRSLEVIVIVGIAISTAVTSGRGCRHHSDCVKRPEHDCVESHETDESDFDRFQTRKRGSRRVTGHLPPTAARSDSAAMQEGGHETERGEDEAHAEEHDRRLTVGRRAFQRHPRFFVVAVEEGPDHRQR